ncbi:MAG: CheR family methyltransferase [Thermodesulfobacteriota bacterium]
MLSDVDLKLLLDRLDLTWEGYRRVRKGVKKRLFRRLKELGLTSWTEYLNLVDSDPRIRTEARRSITVSISRLYRDAVLWRLLEDEILPELFIRDDIRAWSAGCAGGEEVYSLKMVYDLLKGRHSRVPDLQIIATDLNPACLDRARAGLYTAGGLKEVPESPRSMYFRKERRGGLYRVDDRLKEGLTWLEHDLIHDPPPGVFDLIFMRNNVFTYYRRGLQEKALRAAVESLASGGFLIIGLKEGLPAAPPALETYSGLAWVWRKTG